ncbi:MAG: aspartate/glutamate racemase family protein [Desulfopila sp.]|jgi:aspartate racemase|nr:aspartate/glutamate racemase family protein [Desulfopila sp.]
MKTIGLLGGMSWESTLQYYRLLNQGVQKALGGLHSARIVLHSVDFGPIETLMRNDEWDAIGDILGDAAAGLEKAGADFFLLCTNTMHVLAADILTRVDIPMLHIADATGDVLQREGVNTAGLLGTAFTMEQEFYRQRLAERYGMDVIVPQQGDREIINRVIFDELCCGRMVGNSKQEYIRIMKWLADQGAEAVILGCTEIGLLVQQEDIKVRLFDTTPLHAARAVEMALEQVDCRSDTK